MIDAAHLEPHESGPCANPVLFGVALALAELFPIETTSCSTGFPTVVEAAPAEFAANDSAGGGGAKIAA